MCLTRFRTGIGGSFRTAEKAPHQGRLCYYGGVIYLFHGSDAEKVRTKAFAWVAAARTKEPNLAYTRLSREELSAEALGSAASSGGLFVRRALVLIDDPFPTGRTKDADEEVDEEVLGVGSVLEEYADALVSSDNAIVIVAPKLTAARLKKLGAKAAKVYAFDTTAARASVQRGFNSALVNALAARDAQKLWLEVVRALRVGDAPEMLHGLLHWKARDLMSKGSRTWKPLEARKLSLDLISLVQESRRKSLDFALELERFALSI